jgi:hypothetical protein
MVVIGMVMDIIPGIGDGGILLGGPVIGIVRGIIRPCMSEEDLFPY